MVEQKGVMKMKRIARFALFGAVGFGIGGLFLGPVALFAFAGSFQRTDWPAAIFAFAVLGLGFAAKGALGGTALGLASRKGRRMTASLALFAAIGFLAGGLLFLFLVPGGMFRNVFSITEMGYEPTAIWLLVAAVFGVLGFGLAANELLGQTAPGLTLTRGRRRVAALAILGAIGLLVGGLLWAFLSPGGMYLAKSSGIILLDGALGGAALGLALRDKRKMIDLTLAGAFGFWLGLMIADYFTTWLQSGWLLLPVIKFCIQGIIGGASLGAILGYLERQQAAQYINNVQ